MSRIESGQLKVVSAGVDWLSLRSKKWDEIAGYNTLADHIFEEARAAGQKVESSVRVGFSGRAVAGCFLGHKESESLFTLSSEVALKHSPLALKLGGSVARIDLQATVDTESETTNLASSSFYQARQMPLCGGRPRELKLTQTHPAGDTLNVNKRTSDYYGRLYDFGAAHASGQKHRFWRYEVEYKRSLAKHIANTLRLHDDPEIVAEHLVYTWYLSRIPYVAYTPRQLSSPLERMPSKPERDVLRWFEESLSVCVGRAIKDYGRERVFKALSLDRYLIPNESEVSQDVN